MIRRVLSLILTLSLVVSQTMTAFAQSERSLETNPCEDSSYVKLKFKDVDNMSAREFEIFKQKDAACNSYQIQSKKSAVSSQEKSPVVACLLSVVIVGAGQHYNGQHAKGFIQEALFVGGIAAALKLGYKDGKQSYQGECIEYTYGYCTGRRNYEYTIPNETTTV